MSVLYDPLKNNNGFTSRLSTATWTSTQVVDVDSDKFNKIMCNKVGSIGQNIRQISYQYENIYIVSYSEKGANP